MRTRRIVGLVGLLALTGALTVGVVVAPAGAAEFGPIDNVTDLRDVIENQATDPAGDTVTLAAGTTFTLTCASGGDLDHDPATPLTIIGNGSTIAMEPGCDERVLEHGDIIGGDGLLRLEGFTIGGGNITAGGDGGGVAAAGDVELIGMTFTDNHVAIGSSSGGGVASGGHATVIDSVFDFNTATGSGGGLRVQEGLTMERSSVTDNTGGLSGVGDVGGGISVDGTSTITSSTISGNSAGEGDNGGGIDFEGGTLTLVNTTVTDNTTNEFGGGMSAENESDIVVLIYSTVVGNTGPELANVAFGEIESFASVVALPQGGGANCFGDNPTTTFGYNVDDDGTCGFGAGPGDRSNFTEPLLLGALANNGGPTETLLPELTSPLVGAVPDAACQDDGASGITDDQRALPRPAPGLVGCDVGAVEVQLAAEPVPEPVVLVPTFTG